MKTREKCLCSDGGLTRARQPLIKSDLRLIPGTYGWETAPPSQVPEADRLGELSPLIWTGQEKETGVPLHY